MVITFYFSSDDEDEPARSGIKQRLFCDICDVFDEHDTDDCPTQSSGAPDNQGTTYHGNRNEDRAYCDICEGMEKLNCCLLLFVNICSINDKILFVYRLCRFYVCFVLF